MTHMEKTLNHEVVTTKLPDLPSQGHVVCRQSIGHLPDETAIRLLRRLLARSAYGARKFGTRWRGRKNTVELCEETTDAIVYACQETANVTLGLTPLDPGSYRASLAFGELDQAARYAALADHHCQNAHRLIWEFEVEQP